jgi:hypothetical protein
VTSAGSGRKKPRLSAIPTPSSTGDTEAYRVLGRLASHQAWGLEIAAGDWVMSPILILLFKIHSIFLSFPGSVGHLLLFFNEHPTGGAFPAVYLDFSFVSRIIKEIP